MDPSEDGAATNAELTQVAYEQRLRRQIGQDLHDGVGQLLTGTAFMAKALQHSLPAEHQPQVERIVALINQAIARVRSLSRGLSPMNVQTYSLESMLCDTVREATDLLGVRCELVQEHAIDAPDAETITQLGLIAREAITNAVRHGRAQRIVVRLTRNAEVAVLAVEDDGIGFTPGDLQREGLGLRSMRQRAQMVGGSLSILRAQPGAAGTTVRCTFRAAEPAHSYAKPR